MEVKDYPDYLVFRNGAVLSKKTKKFLKPCPDRGGYNIVNLYKNKKKKTFKVHRLVARHYLNKPDIEGISVDHINRNKTDNRLSNLRWATRSQQGQNRGMLKTNTSGIQYVIFHKLSNVWAFKKIINKKKFEFTNKNKQLVLWVKFIYFMRNRKSLRH